MLEPRADPWEQFMKSKLSCLATALAAAGFSSGLAFAQTPAQDSEPAGWTWRATLYGWFPDARATASANIPGGGTLNVETDPGRYLSDLQFAFMGGLEARRGPWSFAVDAITVDFGKIRSNVTSVPTPAGPMNLTAVAQANLDLKAFIGAFEAGYTIAQSPHSTIDVVGGARYLRVKAGVDYELSDPAGNVLARGNAGRTRDFWDAVVGIRGRADIGDRWYVPYYADLGGGASRFTWQAFAGLGYRFDAFDAMVGYRHLAYDFDADNPVSRMRFGGPVAGVGFRF
jgi:hypothetical protein